MREEDAEQLLEDLRSLERLLDGSSIGISGRERLLVSTMLCEMRGAEVSEPRLADVLRGLCFAIRGCYAESYQAAILTQVCEHAGLSCPRERAMEVLWCRAREAVAELRSEMNKFRRRSA
jgi:hypothetical protein